MKEIRITQLLNPVCLITLTGLIFAMAAIFFVLLHYPELGLIFMFLHILCDLLDGWLARKLNQTSAFGAELDILSDMVGFGVSPAIFFYVVTGNPWVIPFSTLLMAAGGLRLARYSYVGLIERNGKEYYAGLPIYYSTSLLFLTWPVLREFNATIQTLIFAIGSVVLSFLFISRIPIRKGAAFERWVLFAIFPIITIYYVLCTIGIHLW